jgi:type IV secretory pathway VirB2 component (pilin)
MLNLSLIENPTNYDSLSAFILNLVNFAVEFSVLIAVFALIAAGFKYILAMGDEDKVEDATKSLIFAIIGLIIVFIAPLVVRYITSEVLMVE